LLGLVGAVVAMSQPRSFRPSKSFELIRTELEQAAGRQFDPHLTQKILQLLEKGQLDFLQS